MMIGLGINRQKITIIVIIILIFTQQVSHSQTPTIQQVSPSPREGIQNLGQKLVQDNNSIKLENGFIRDGKTFSSAINLVENVSKQGTFSSTETLHYYRYFSQYPYQYVKIDLQSNDSNVNLILIDQLNSTILSDVTLSQTKTIQIKSSDPITTRERLRFIGFYYIQVVSNSNSSINYNLSFSFLKGSGSSLWTPIVITPGNPAWTGTFTPRENSGVRSSLFYSFSVKNTAPEILVSLNANSEGSLMLYGPDFSFLTYGTDSNRLTWYAEKEGMYYLEINGKDFSSQSVTLNLNLLANGTVKQNSIRHPMEIERHNGRYKDHIYNSNRFLKLYLFHGENISLNIGNPNKSLDYYANVYGPWGGFWKKSFLKEHSANFVLNNIPESGYYIFDVYGSIGDYFIDLEFKFSTTVGSSWQSALFYDIHTKSRFKESSFLLSESSFYYHFRLDKNYSYNVSINSSSTMAAELLDTRRQRIGNILVSSKSISFSSIFYNASTYGSDIYLNLTLAESFAEYTLIVERITLIPSNSALINGKLSFIDPVSNLPENLPLLKVLIMEKDIIRDDILFETSTSLSGEFSVLLTGNLDPDENNQDLYIKAIFQGPALQIRKYNQVDETYNYVFDINDTLGSTLNLGEVTIPLRKVGNIFYEITTAWLWLNNFSNLDYGPEQVIVFYSINSDGTYYEPYGEIIPGSPFKYFITLLGGSNDDDALDDTVLLHEYGHHVAEIYDIYYSPAGAHSFGTVSSPGLAHGEGFPTFFSNIITNSPIYKDTYSSTYFGFNAESSTYLPTNKIFDLMGSYGESSIISLYWDLVDTSNGDDLNGDGVFENTTLSLEKLFDVFFNYRGINSSGISSADQLYEGLVYNKVNDIDTLSRTFYEHGTGNIAYPFINPEENKIISNFDMRANFTWKLFDSNPDQYTIYLNNSQIFSGKWNFTEEVLFLNLSQFNLNLGSKSYFKLELIDSLGNVRTYNYWVKVYQDINTMGTSFSNAIELSLTNKFTSLPNVTGFLSFSTVIGGVYNFSVIGTYNTFFTVTIYKPNQEVIYDLDTVSNETTNFFVYVPVNSVIYFKYQYIAGNGTIRILSNGLVLGTTSEYPLYIENNSMIDLPYYNLSTHLYYSFYSSAYNRNISLTFKTVDDYIANFYTSNGSLFNSIIISKNMTTFFLSVPLKTDFDPRNKFDPFDTILIEFISIEPNIIQPSLNVVSLKSLYLSPVLDYKIKNNVLLLEFSGISHIQMTMFVNKNIYDFTFPDLKTKQIRLDLTIYGTHLFFIVLNYVDMYGLWYNYKFKFNYTYIQSKLSSTTPNTSGSSIPVEPNQNLSWFIFFSLLGAGGIALASWYRLKYRQKI